MTDLLPRQVQEESGNYRQSGDKWNFVAQITDDGANDPAITPVNLNGATTPNGGLVDVIFEGTDFNGNTYRQLIATVEPQAGKLTLPEPVPGGGDSHLWPLMAMETISQIAMLTETACQGKKQLAV